MNTIVTARIQSVDPLQINNGASVEFNASIVDSNKPFFVVSSTTEQPAVFSKESAVLIKRARLEFYGAQGLRPGLIQGNTNYPALAAIAYELPYVPNVNDLLLNIPYFNEWFQVGQKIEVYGNDIALALVTVRGWYDSRGIASRYNGQIFEAVLSLEVEAIL